MEQPKYDVFISYSRKDYVDEAGNVIPDNVVSKVKDKLKGAGLNFWFDEHGIYSGQEFPEEIVDAISASDIFVFLSTANSNKSTWTSKEIATAAELNKLIIPVRIDNTTYNKKVLFRIADISYIAYYSNPEKGLNDLVDSIKTHLKLEEEKRQEEHKKKENERREKEEQQNKIIESIKLSCIQLNNEEKKLQIDRNSLLLDAQKVINKEEREKLKTFIESSSPLRLKYIIEENKQTQEETIRLQKQLQQVTGERNSLLKSKISKKTFRICVAIASLLYALLIIIMFSMRSGRKTNIDTPKDTNRVDTMVSPVKEKSGSLKMKVEKKLIKDAILGSYEYTGQINTADKPDGKGEAKFFNGDVYSGDFSNGSFISGRYTWADDGSYFEGKFRNNEPDYQHGKHYDKNGKERK